jgi:hypothetical protein
MKQGMPHIHLAPDACLNIGDTCLEGGEDCCREVRATHLRSAGLLSAEISRLAPILCGMVQLRELGGDAVDALEVLGGVRDIRLLQLSWELVVLCAGDAGIDMIELFEDIGDEVAFHLFLEAVYGEAFDEEDDPLSGLRSR